LLSTKPAMTEVPLLLAQLRDPRLAPYMVSAAPAWLWAADGSRVLWANAAGAVALDAATPAALRGRRFATTKLPAAVIPRLAATLSRSGDVRLERLRGFGAALGRPLACACSRIMLADGATAIRIVAAEPAGRALPLAERVRRMLSGCDAPIAVFSTAGELIHATAGAAQRLAGTTSLGMIGAGLLADKALAGGPATTGSAVDRARVERLDSGTDSVLVVTWTDVAGPLAEPVAPATDESPGGATPGEAAAAERHQNEEVQPPPALPADPPPLLAPGADPQPLSVSRPTLPVRRPLRFVWQMDADETFTLGSSEFADAAGPRTAALLGRPWREIAAELALDPDGRVATALESHDTWSGIVVAWPVDASGERAAVELSGLPIFERGGTFRGYRGFGVCRHVARLSPDHGRTAPRAGCDATQREPRTVSAAAVVAAAAVAPEPRPLLTIVPAAKNVVPFRNAGGPAPDKRPALTPVERSAFREIGKAAGADPDGDDGGRAARALPAGPSIEHRGGAPMASGATAIASGDRRATSHVITPELYDIVIPSAYAPHIERPHPEELLTAEAANGPQVIDCLPLAVLVCQADRLIYANRALLNWTGWADLAEIAAAGGLDNLLVERAEPLPADGIERTLALARRNGDTLPVDARLFTVPWDGGPALALILARSAAARGDTVARAPRPADADIREFEAILATATDGVVRLGRDGRIISLDRGAEALFGYDSEDLAGHPFIDLLAPESHRAALDHLDAVSLGTGATDGGRDVVGRLLHGGQVVLSMTMGRIGEGRFCAVFRDLTRWKRAEPDLIGARPQTANASSAKSDFLAKISHEIRTPLNSIIGFSEMMIEERSGPVGNDRYRDYLKDIHASGGHLVSLINDLLDLSKIEAGKVDLVFAPVDLNALTQQCVTLMQPQANRERIIIRISLSANLPAVLADARSVRQIVLNLLTNSIKFTGAGGQVIVSTARGDGGDAILRVRDTGVGMSEKEIATALEPFRQLATSTRWGSGGTGLGLPLTKALAEANRAVFTIKSAVNAGTLVEITFKATRVPVS
jgi:PAS domain S-box-containing protein